MKPTICYLHGLNCSSTIFSYLQSQLPEHTPWFIDYKSQESIEDSYQFVLNRLPRKKNFTIIGHSLGGILGYLIASRTDKVDKLVSISSPFGGSQAAGLLRWFFPDFKVLKDLARNSKIIEEIQEYGPECPFLSLVSIGGHLPFLSGQNDGIVTIESQVCVHPTARVELNSNHFEAVQDKVGIQAIKDFVFK